MPVVTTIIQRMYRKGACCVRELQAWYLIPAVRPLFKANHLNALDDIALGSWIRFRWHNGSNSMFVRFAHLLPPNNVGQHCRVPMQSIG